MCGWIFMSKPAARQRAPPSPESRDLRMACRAR
jgi:hypothetical protein